MKGTNSTKREKTRKFMLKIKKGEIFVKKKNMEEKEEAREMKDFNKRKWDRDSKKKSKLNSMFLDIKMLYFMMFERKTSEYRK